MKLIYSSIVAVLAASSANAFAPLNDDDYDLAMKRIRDLLEADLEAESSKQGANEVMWAVFTAFLK